MALLCSTVLGAQKTEHDAVVVTESSPLCLALVLAQVVSSVTLQWPVLVASASLQHGALPLAAQGSESD